MNLFKAGLHNVDSGSLSALRIVELLGNSVAVGTVLMLATVWANSQRVTRKHVESSFPSPAERVLSSANVLFLCLGMTGIMILVSNNLARAFAIGAAIALVRFRIKVDSEALGMSLFYGVLCGMASGVDQPAVAWGLAGLFCTLQFIVYGVARFEFRRSLRSINKHGLENHGLVSDALGISTQS